MMHEIKMFDRTGVLSLDGFSGSGADWLERYKPIIGDGKTVVVSPHKVYGPENNDLVLQLRKRKIGKVIKKVHPYLVELAGPNLNAWEIPNRTVARPQSQALAYSPASP